MNKVSRVTGYKVIIQKKNKVFNSNSKPDGNVISITTHLNSLINT